MTWTMSRPLTEVSQMGPNAPPGPRAVWGLGPSEHFLPLTGAWQAGLGNPEPDKRHLCSRLDPRQAASFPGADLMFLKRLKPPEVCALPLLAQFCCQQRQRPRMGAGGLVERWTPGAQASHGSPLPRLWHAGPGPGETEETLSNL